MARSADDYRRAFDSSGFRGFSAGSDPGMGGKPLWTISIGEMPVTRMQPPGSNDLLDKLVQELPAGAFTSEARLVDLAGQRVLVTVDPATIPKMSSGGPIGLTPHAIRSKRAAKDLLARRRRTLERARVVQCAVFEEREMDAYDYWHTKWSVTVTADGWTTSTGNVTLDALAAKVKDWRYRNNV